MALGENSIKRAVKNNGYSKVKTTAPDMENSVVEVKEVKKPSKPKTTKKVVKNDNFKCYKVGDALPIYLL